MLHCVQNATRELFVIGQGSLAETVTRNNLLLYESTQVENVITVRLRLFIIRLVGDSCSKVVFIAYFLNNENGMLGNSNLVQPSYRSNKQKVYLSTM